MELYEGNVRVTFFILKKMVKTCANVEASKMQDNRVTTEKSRCYYLIQKSEDKNSLISQHVNLKVVPSLIGLYYDIVKNLLQHFHFHHFDTCIAYAENIEFIIINDDSFFLLWNGFVMVDDITG